MRLFYTVSILLLVSCLATAQTYIIDQNFEGIKASGDTIANWVFTNTKTWNLGGYGHNSDKYAGWNESTNGDHSIRSPKVTNPGTLTFWVAGFNDATNLSVKVQISSDGTTWTDKGTYPSKGAGGDFGLAWAQKTIAIKQSGSYYIRWTTTSYVTGGFYLDDIKLDNTVTGVESVGGIPSTFALDQNYPNPFNPSTVIGFSVPVRSQVTLTLHDVLGREVARLFDGITDAGSFRSEWKGAAPSGIYFYRLSAIAVSDPSLRFEKTRKMVLMK